MRATEIPNGVVMHVQHRSGTALAIPVSHDAAGSFGVVHAHGTRGHAALQMKDTDAAFRAQMVAFIESLQCGAPSYPFDETVELMAAVFAGRESRQRGGATVALGEIPARLAAEVEKQPQTSEARA